MSYTLIERKELTSAASSISFENIPQFYSDLVLQVSSRTDGGGPDCLIRPNGSTSNMSGIRLRGNGSNAASSVEGGYLENSVSTDTASTFSNGTAYFSNYSGSTFKLFSTDAIRENNATDSRQAIMANIWSDTAPITSLTLVPSASVNFVAGSSFSLYGINRQQAIGKPKAIGGAISFANGYWVHTFTGSGTFVPQEDLECQYLVVAGGGGGGGETAGGGGAGGYRSSVAGELSGGGLGSENSLLLSPAEYSVVVGAGGVGATVNSGRGASGSNSVFASITSIGGGGGGSDSTQAGLAGDSGGSGGGADYTGSSSRNGSGTTGQGFAGGLGNNTATSAGFAAGGGGGASANGLNAGSGSHGGAGVSSSITGSGIVRAGGGGGARGTSLSVSSGGAGGGGAGAKRSASAAVSGTSNTGGGGGGGDVSSSQASGSGGSGIVIIRYRAD